MRVTRKLILGIVVGIIAVMIVNATLRVQRETAVLNADTRRDHEFVGRTLRAAFLDVLRTDGEARAESLIDAAHAGYPDIAVRVVHTLDPSDPRRPVLSGAQLAPLARGREVTAVQGGRLLSYFPIAGTHLPNHALELSESTAPQEEVIRESVVRNVVTTLVIVLLCAAIASALGLRLVGRPLARLGAKARRVGAGDLGHALVLRQRDEIGELADEMNAMCERLADAQRAVASEAAARILALEQLRHADRLRTVGQLASGLAHEMGTPLNVVLGRAGLLAAGDATPAEVADNARIITEQTKRMTALIRQLLDFARRRGPSVQPTDLRDVTARVAELLGPLAHKHRCALEVAAGEAGATAAVDPNQIQQVVSNLVVNALQAMPAGGRVALSTGVARERPPPDHGGPVEPYAFVTVEDSGAGIEPEHLARIFEPFFTTKDVGEGTGLGLSVAYGIARDHGGWIGVRSERGRGSRFTLYVPLAQRAGRA